MEQTLFISLFKVGVVVFLLSLVSISEEQVHKVILSFMSLVIFVALVLSSFNIEQIYFADGIAKTNRIYDYGYIGISLAFFILSFLNTLVVLFLGSLETFLQKKGV